MNGFSGWLRRVGAKISSGLRGFMAGRYGTDKLNIAILGLGVTLCVISLFVRQPVVNLILTLLAYGLMIWVIFRTFSRNTYRRYRENRRFLMFFTKLKDRKHRYFECPRCRQSTRVPRGKGKIAITCPKCGERFIRKS